jgi:PAS domain S-box-containing protein
MNKSKILIVEDERNTAGNLKNDLVNLGYEVTGIVSDAIGLYASVGDNMPDLVLIDMQHESEYSNIHLADEIKEKYLLPFIFLTSKAGSEFPEGEKTTDPFGFIEKPYREIDLQKHLEMVLQKNRMEKRISHLNAILKSIRDIQQLILKTSDRTELLLNACKALISTMAYSGCWMVMVDQDGKCLESASEGFVTGFDEFIKQYRKGIKPACLLFQEKDGEPVNARSNSHECSGCPLRDKYPDNGSLVSSIRHQDHFYGYLAVSMPHALADNPEEIALITEISDYLGQAFTNLEQQKQKKEAEKALLKSEILFRHAFDYASSAVSIIGIDGKFQRANVAFTRLLEYTEEELQQLHFKDITHPDDQHAGSDMLKMMSHDEADSAFFEKRYISKNNRIIWALVSVSLVRDEQNKPDFIVTHLVDLSERKHAEQEFQKLSQVVQQSPESIVVTNPEGIIEYVNPAVCSKSGYSANELIGMKPGILSSGETPREEYKILWETIKAGNEWKGEFHNRKKNGELYWERASISPIKDQAGNILNFLSIKEDITEQKHQESIQRVLYNISRQVSESTGVRQLLEIIKTELSVLINTRNFHIVFYSEDSGMLSSAYGNDEKDAFTSWPAGKSLTGYVIRHNKSLLLKHKDFQELVATGEVELVGSPSEIWLGVPLTVEGKPYGAFVVQDYQNAEAYGENELRILEFVAGQVSISIQRQKALNDIQHALLKAEAGDRLKTAFINNISHEIRTPLNGILGFTEMILNPDSSPEDNILYYSVIKKSSKRLLETVNSYMDISLIVSGTMEISRRALNIDLLMEEIFEEFVDICEPKGIELKVSRPIHQEALKISTDNLKLHKVLAHLIDNAVKFTQKGLITFGYELTETDIQFFISDTGSGIQPDVLDVIFDAFMQADVSPTRGYEGSGLGLTISHGMVKLLGGKLWVDTASGKGSTFFFTLPLRENPVIAVVKAPEIPKSRPSDKPLILIAEDDDSNYKYIEIVLQYASYNVIRAENGYEAVECCHKYPELSLVLMDIKMPMMDGFEATRQIKTFRPDLPVIALTAHVTAEDRNAAMASGCNEYITKPVSKTTLLEIIGNSI